MAQKVTINSNESQNIEAGIFKSLTAAVGGAIENYGSVTIDRSTFTYNQSQNSDYIDQFGGGAIFNANFATVNNSTFSDNRASYGGGAIDNSGTATLNISSSSFSNNSASSGGALENKGTATLNLDAVNFAQNSATKGGALYSTGDWGTSKVTIANSSFSGNDASYGGAVNNSGTSNLNMSNTNFTDNRASYGGALDNSGNVQITASTFAGNSVSVEGGAIRNYQTAEFSHAFFSANSATKGGGAVRNFGTATFDNSTFSNNYARGGGGLDNNGTVTFNGSTFLSNRATHGGAVYNSAQAKLTISNGVFEGNQAEKKGGAIYNDGYNGSPTMRIENTTFTNNRAANGGAICNTGTISLNNVALETASDTINNTFYDSGAIYAGTLTVAGKVTFGAESGSGIMVTNDQACTLNFDVSALTSGNETAWLSDWSRVNNQGNITITVNEAQALGSYKLASNVDKFNFAVTVKNTTGEELGKFTSGADQFTIGNFNYSLTRDKELTLTISDGSQPPPPPAKLAASDIDGNGVSDVMFQYTGGDNQLGFWMNGTTEWKGGNPPEPQTWDVIGAYDMDGSGKADVVMLGNVEVNGVKGAYVGYRKDGDMTTWENIDYLTNPDGIDWKVKIGNVTGKEGKNSLVWHAAELGAVGVWLDGTSKWQAINGYFDKNWTLLGTGDFTGDGKDEILFQNADGFYTVDLDSNFRELGHTGAGWAMRAVGDYSGDGKDDLVFFHQETGSVMMYQDGTTFQNLGQLDAKDWFIVGAGDYNGDQQDDLLVRQYSTGMLGYYASGDLSKWVEMGRGVDMNWTVIA